ncbi:PfkB family carbohydrate kinase [Micromonospora sp. U21]|uniref:PfkB family carbohydrate kinase n=1 Tax=Micromonospora sp. U21 TaxID=2824899 RepID=UPI001B393AF2|nr:PfkB family carbohydrate kinase [Micromonospora sp. U21]MBQ0900573.1 hypothetical protein [Micromonospora sp. U21]
MPRTRVVVVGSANMDLVAMAPALPRPGETMLGTDFVMVPGGKGANQAVAALAVGWGEGRDLIDAVRWASAAGAACVRRLGASVALPRRAEIDELYAPG